MNENTDPQNPDEVSRSSRPDDQTPRPLGNQDRGSAAGGRRSSSAGGYRGSGAEVPRTFPSQPNGPARVSPPVAPPERRPDVPSTQAQNPVDGSRHRGGSTSQRSSPYQPNGQQHSSHQPGSLRQGGQPGYPGHQSAQGDFGNQPRPDRQNDQPNLPQHQSQYGQPQQNGPRSYQGQDNAGQNSSGSTAVGTGATAGTGAAAAGAGTYQTGPNSQQSGSAGYPGAPGNPNGPGNPTGSNAYSAAHGSGPCSSEFSAVGSQPGPGGPVNPNGPGGPVGPDGFGPYGAQQPPRREKKGPGWGATIAIGLVAALLGGALAFGGNYALSALQNDEPRKVAEETIETPDWTQVAEKTSDSVMSIQVGTRGQVQGLGSGALYDDQGHVITNNHVVAPADTPDGEIAVTMKNGETTEAKIVGRDPSTDIAVIKLEQVPDGVKPLVMGDSKKLTVGDPVMALGNPLGLANTVTTGIVSALDRPVSTENIGDDASSQEKEMTITNAIQTDAAINPGNSGGPLVNGDGQFIGVNSAAASLSQGEGGQSGSIGIGFAIPANQAVMIADQLISSGKAQHPFLGITLTDGHINSGGISRGSAKVQSVAGGSPAAKAGIKDGDDIVEVAGTKVNNAIALRALVRAQPVNTPVEVTVVSGGKEQKLDVTLVLQ
ncbi:putative serine protease PepD [Brevibacterium iodinum ATCC 49514]|uniref:Putative serine protease PepD n=1 Tax=Brevibacterium iodinum ATCC 49514 TaxID=1255616 RepID=A0A2H1HTY9_9MICO|nr:trypsin-like peptidase domain-containing protein [Brevibacterium iodinum]SMX66316.1 putative serine protease PepD [Brevibacterium iodinum ATCC 49514]SUW13549.1 Putative serine protease HtrA [Brevibacterium iodinum]